MLKYSNWSPNWEQGRAARSHQVEIAHLSLLAFFLHLKVSNSSCQLCVERVSLRSLATLDVCENDVQVFSLRNCCCKLSLFFRCRCAVLEGCLFGLWDLQPVERMSAPWCLGVKSLAGTLDGERTEPSPLTWRVRSISNKISTYTLVKLTAELIM